MRHFEPFGDATQHTGIWLQDISRLPLNEGAEVPAGGVNLPRGHRHLERAGDFRVAGDVLRR